MKILSVLLIAIVLSVTPAFCQTGTKEITFQWEQPLPVDDLAGWNLYYGTASGVYERIAIFNYGGTPSATYTQEFILTSPTGQVLTYYFVLTAFDGAGNESDFSNEVLARVDFLAPGVPVNFRATIKVQ
jgi:hypothetical protein